MPLSPHRAHKRTSCTESQNGESEEDSASERVRLNTLYDLHILSTYDSNTQQKSKHKKKDRSSTALKYGKTMQSPHVSRNTSTSSNSMETEAQNASSQDSVASTFRDFTLVNVLPSSTAPQVPAGMTNVEIFPGTAPLRTTQVTHGNARVTIFPSSTASNPLRDFSHVTVQPTQDTVYSIREATDMTHDASGSTDYDDVEADSSFPPSDPTSAVESTESLNMDIQKIMSSMDRTLTAEQHKEMKKVVKTFIAKDKKSERLKSIPRKESTSDRQSSSSFGISQPSTSSWLPPSRPADQSPLPPSRTATIGDKAVHLCYLTKNPLTESRRRERHSTRERSVNTGDDLNLRQQPPESSAERRRAAEACISDELIWSAIKRLGYDCITVNEFLQVKRGLMEALLSTSQSTETERENTSSAESRMQGTPGTTENTNTFSSTPSDQMQGTSWTTESANAFSSASQDQMLETPRPIGGVWRAGNDLSRDDHTVPKTSAAFSPPEREFSSNALPRASHAAEVSAVGPTNATSLQQTQRNPGTDVSNVDRLTPSFSKLSMHTPHETGKGNKENLNPNVLKKPSSSKCSIRTASGSADTASLIEEGSRESVHIHPGRNASQYSIRTASDSDATARLIEDDSRESVHTHPGGNASQYSIGTATDSGDTANLIRDGSHESVHTHAETNASQPSIATGTDSGSTAHLTEDHSQRSIHTCTRGTQLGYPADASFRIIHGPDDDSSDPDTNVYPDGDQDGDPVRTHVHGLVAREIQRGILLWREICEAYCRDPDFRRLNQGIPGVSTQRSSRPTRGGRVAPEGSRTRRRDRNNHGHGYNPDREPDSVRRRSGLEQVACNVRRQVEELRQELRNMRNTLATYGSLRRQDQTDPGVSTRRTSRPAGSDRIVTEESRPTCTGQSEPMAWDDNVIPSEAPGPSHRTRDTSVPPGTSTGIQRSRSCEVWRRCAVCSCPYRPPLPGYPKPKYGYPVQKTDCVELHLQYQRFWEYQPIPGDNKQARCPRCLRERARH